MLNDKERVGISNLLDKMTGNIVQKTSCQQIKDHFDKGNIIA